MTKQLGKPNTVKNMKRGKEMVVVLHPGDPLPAGTFVNGWKLDMSYGVNVFQLIYIPEENDG